jgi:hypothetical protein
MKYFLMLVSLKNVELYDLIGQPDAFSYAELKLATDNFSPQNILGEGGYGPVYKVAYLFSPI